MKKKIIIILSILILITISILIAIYIFRTDLYIKYKYKNNFNIEEKYVNNDLSKIQISDKITNYITTKEVYTYITLSKSGVGTSEIYTNGQANLKFYITEEKNAILEFTNITDSKGTSYLEELEDKQIKININKEHAKYLTYDQNFLYILTEEGNLYGFTLNQLNNNVEFENNISYIKKGACFLELTTKNIKDIIQYSNNNQTTTRIYALLDTGELINIRTKEKFEDEEKCVSNFRFGNARLAINRDATIQYCNGYDDYVNKCTDDYLSDVITDTNGNIITIYSIIEYKSNLYIIDTKGNIYKEPYDNQNHQKITKLKKYNNKNVEKLIFISKSSSRYILKDLIIYYSNGTRTIFKDISQLDIYVIN